jgi:hypothetical protein
MKRILKKEFIVYYKLENHELKLVKSFGQEKSK